MAREGIRLVHGLTKRTLITYYSVMKKDPKYAFLHAFFLKGLARIRKTHISSSEARKYTYVSKEIT